MWRKKKKPWKFQKAHASKLYWFVLSVASREGAWNTLALCYSSPHPALPTPPLQPQGTPHTPGLSDPSCTQTAKAWLRGRGVADVVLATRRAMAATGGRSHPRALAVPVPNLALGAPVSEVGWCWSESHILPRPRRPRVVKVAPKGKETALGAERADGAGGCGHADPLLAERGGLGRGQR